MSLQLNPNSGLAFQNDRGSEKAPQFKGEILFDGKRIEVAIWERTTKSGKKMLSMNVQDPVAAELERIEKRREYLHEIANAGK